MTTQPLKKGATYDDLRRVPEHYVAEMFDGELYASPRPAIPHARAASVLGALLGAPFDQGRDGPGGWVILDEPELHFGRDVLVPDIAGWRRERLPALLPLLPDADAPTVMRIDGAEQLALQALCHGAVTWQRLEELKRAGARGLMVLPVEGMLA